MNFEKHVAALESLVQHFQEIPNLILPVVGQDISENEKQALVDLAVDLINPRKVINGSVDDFFSVAAVGGIHVPDGNSARAVEIIPHNPSIIHPFEHCVQTAARIDHSAVRILHQEEFHRLVVIPAGGRGDKSSVLASILVIFVIYLMISQIFGRNLVLEDIRESLGDYSSVSDLIHIFIYYGTSGIRHEVLKYLS